ncbi:conjugative transposon TraN protein [Pedobacter sp. UYEF25]
MKNIFYLASVIFITATTSFAQKSQQAEGGNKTDLPIVYLNDNISVHFISPEPIQYVDISNKRIFGDLPVKNILRIKHIDSLKKAAYGYSDNAIITIVGEKFIAQYSVIYDPSTSDNLLKTNIDVLPNDMKALNIPGITMSEREMRSYALEVIKRKPKIFSISANAYGIKTTVNNIYTLDDYVFLDISFKNKTNLKYDIDEVRFKIEDKKIVKATNVQSLEIKPDFILNDSKSFKSYFRNVYVFKKFTFPGNKVLSVEMNEKQISGRTITLLMHYSDLLNADVIE